MARNRKYHSGYNRNKNSQKAKKHDWTDFQRKVLNDLTTNTGLLNDGRIGDISIESIATALRYPKTNWRILLRLSSELMHVSPHYYRMNMFYSNMAMFCWGIDLYDVKDSANRNTLKKSFMNLSAKLESMNLKHEFSKIMKVLPYQDLFCGLLVENDNGSFIQRISLDMCKLYEVQDGLYNFILNLSSIDPLHIDAYPEDVVQAYINYRDELNPQDNWYYPPADKQICIKLNSQWVYPYPLLIGLIKDILDLDVFKKLKLQSARTDNYKAIAIKVPIDESQVDKPLLTPDTLAIFAEINRESMADDIGLLYTLGGNAEVINYKDSANTRNNVSDANDEIYNSSGITKELFNGSASATAVNLSVENDSGFMYALYRQFERWVNRFIKVRKFNKAAFKFSFYLLDVTIFNKDSVANKYKDACALGATLVDKWMAALNITPSRLLGSYITNTEIYDFQNNFVPLSSAYNSSGTQAADSTDKKNGRPTNDSKGIPLTESGEQTADSDANADR